MHQVPDRSAARSSPGRLSEGTLADHADHADRADRADHADHAELVTLARESGGEFTAASVRQWLSRQPEAFALLRCRESSRLRTFTSQLTLRTPERDELEAAPVVSDVWHDVS